MTGDRIFLLILHPAALYWIYRNNFLGVNVHTLVAVCLLAATASGPSVHNANIEAPPVTKPALVEIPKAPSGLALYNEKGERVAQCDQKDEAFANCRMERGITLDDVMNAWVHAVRDGKK